MIQVFLFAITVIIVCGCITVIYKCKSDRALMWSGLVLVLFGLIFSCVILFLTDHMYSNLSSEQQEIPKALLSNLYLIIAAIGANFFVNAICSRNKGNSHSIELDMKYEVRINEIK